MKVSLSTVTGASGHVLGISTSQQTVTLQIVCTTNLTFSMFLLLFLSNVKNQKKKFEK